MPLSYSLWQDKDSSFLWGLPEHYPQPDSCTAVASANTASRGAIFGRGAGILYVCCLSAALKLDPRVFHDFSGEYDSLFFHGPSARGMLPAVFLVAVWKWRNSKRRHLGLGWQRKFGLFMCQCDLCGRGDVCEDSICYFKKRFYLFLTSRMWLTEVDDRRRAINIVFLGVTLALPLLLFYFLTGSSLKIRICNSRQLTHLCPITPVWVPEWRRTNCLFIPLGSSQRT